MKNESRIQPTPLHYIACMLAAALVCCSLLCIYWCTTPAYASTRFQQANRKTMSGHVAFDVTETETPPPTTTNTPSPTVTMTSTPNPSTTATHAITPSPTNTRSATPTSTVQYSRAVTNPQTPSPGATPMSSATSISKTTQGTDAHPTPVSPHSATNNLGDHSRQRAQLRGNTFLFSALTIGLGSLALLGLLFIAGLLVVRRHLPLLSSAKLPPSGAAPWSRTRDIDPTTSLHAQQTTTALPISNLPAFQNQTPGELFVDIIELSDPYFQYDPTVS
jgi:hypothetical protein